ncbi:MAG TPA: ABC transporter substrate-binding protein [Conexibacter sp.]|jgi:branched-chain amino acid transport system substrate-binding protein
MGSTVTRGSALLAAAVLAGGLAACGSSSSSSSGASSGSSSTSSGSTSSSGQAAPSADSARVGLVILSGPVGANEDHMMQGFTIAQADIAREGGPRLELVRCEDQVDVDQSTACTRKLTSEDGLKAVILDTASPAALADSAVTARSGVVAMMPSQRDTELTEQGNRLLFRTGISGAVEVEKVAPEIIQQLRPQKVGILAENNSFGQDELKRFTRAFQDASVDVPYSASFEADQTDFSAELAKAKSDGVDLLLMIGEANHGGLISQQAKSLGLSAKLLASSGMTSRDLLDLSRGAMDGQYAWSTLPQAGGGSQEFFREFRAKYGQDPSSISAEAYTALRTLAMAVQRAGGADDANKLAGAMRATSWDSPIGAVKFDDKGQNTNAETELQVVRGNAFEPLSK